MPNFEIELNPVDFITVGTVGPKGQRVFHLQAGQGERIVSVTIEKEQAWALSEAIRELVDDLDRRFPGSSPTQADPGTLNMELREPIEPMFRVAQMGLGYDEDRNLVLLVAQELLSSQGAAEDEFGVEEEVQPGIIRMWCSREQMYALSTHSMQTVQSGRPDPKQNGRLVYYWT